MPTFLQNGAEGGLLGANVAAGASSGGASGNPFDAINVGALAALTYDNTQVMHGAQSYKVVTGSPSANSIVEWTTSLTGSSLTQVWFRVYIYLTSYSATQLRFVSTRNGGTYLGGPALTSVGKVVLLSSTGGTVSTSATTVPLNQWVRYEGFVIGNAATGQLECKIFVTTPDGTTPDETLTSAATVNTNSTITRVDIGDPSSVVSFTYWMDDLAVSDTAYPGPAVYAAQLAGAGTVSTAPLLRNDLEGGTNGTTLTSGNTGGGSGNAFDVVSVGAGCVLAFDNSQVAHGALALKVSAASAVSSFALWGTSLGAGQGQVWFRAYLYVTATPTVNTRVVTFWTTTGGTTLCGTLLVNTAGKVIFQNAASATILTSASTFPLNAWFRVEGYLLPSATVGQLEFKIFTTTDGTSAADTQTSAATQNTGASVGAVAFGVSNAPASAAGPYWLDDLAVSPFGYVGPSGTTGAATLTGAGAVSALETTSAVTTLAGAGTMAILATEQAITALAGAGAVSSLDMTIAGTALTGAGVVSDVVTVRPGAVLIGSGSVSDVAQTGAGTSIAGAGLVNAGSVIRAGTSLAGAGFVNAAGRIVILGTASLQGAGFVNAAGIDPRILTARISQVGELSARISVETS